MPIANPPGQVSLAARAGPGLWLALTESHSLAAGGMRYTLGSHFIIIDRHTNNPFNSHKSSNTLMNRENKSSRMPILALIEA